MPETVHILTPRIDRDVVCEVIGVTPRAAAWKQVDWKDGKANMRLEAIQQGKEFAQIIKQYTELFQVVAEGEDLEEITRRLNAAQWILKVTATPSFDVTAKDSNTIATIAMRLDGTCITECAVIDPETGDAILAWGD